MSDPGASPPSLPRPGGSCRLSEPGGPATVVSPTLSTVRLAPQPRARLFSSAVRYLRTVPVPIQLLLLLLRKPWPGDLIYALQSWERRQFHPGLDGKQSSGVFGSCRPAK